MRFAIFTLLAFAASGQALDRVFEFTHTDSAQSRAEIGTAIRSIGDARDISVDSAQGTLAVHGTLEQIKLAAWLFNELDAPAKGENSAEAEYRLDGDGDNLVRVFYLRNTGSTQAAFQEVATAVRSIGDIRRVFTYYPSKAVAIRGTGDQMALAEWLIHQLDQPAGAPSPAAHEYQMTRGFDHDENTARVFYLLHGATEQDLQEVATAIRTIGDIRRVFTYERTKAIVVRGTQEQAALADWLVSELDSGARGRTSSATYQYQEAPLFGAPAVRVFYLAKANSPQDFQRAATQVRTTTKIRRVFTYGAAQALIVRGTLDQIELAETLLKGIN